MGFSPLANMSLRIPDQGRSNPRQYAYAGGDNFVLASQVDGSIVVALTTSSPIMYLGLTIPLD